MTSQRIRACITAAALLTTLAGLAPASLWADAPPQPTTQTMPTLALAQRPANVPPNYVITPFGYFDPSCVKQIGSQETLLVNGYLQHQNGNIQPMPVCHAPRYTAQGERIEANIVPLPTTDKRITGSAAAINGWVEDSEIIYSGAQIGKVSAHWTVPSPPSIQATPPQQVIYFFPGLMDHVKRLSIVQPVLGWNAFGDAGWTLSSWNCCDNGGAAYYSAPLSVSPGDLIEGTINCPDAHCTTLNVVSTNTRTRAHTALKAIGNQQNFDWVFGGVLEVYGVSQCGHYPADRAITFSSIAVTDVNHQRLTPTWTQTQWPQAQGTPSCNYAVSTTPATTYLYY